MATGKEAGWVFSRTVQARRHAVEFKMAFSVASAKTRDRQLLSKVRLGWGRAQ